jgi:hypothetical protein
MDITRDPSRCYGAIDQGYSRSGFFGETLL